MTTSRRRARAGGAQVSQADIPPRYHWRFRFQTARYGEVVFYMAGTETSRLSTEIPFDPDRWRDFPEEFGQFCIPQYHAAPFEQLMADPEIAQGYTKGLKRKTNELKHKGNPSA